MRTAATGPFQGMSESNRAVEALLTASTSVSFTRSVESTRVWTMVSKRQDLGKRGRIGRSIKRAVRVSFSRGRVSRLKKPPGMRPAA